MTENEIRIQIINEIPQIMKSHGHNCVSDCLCCLTAKLISEGLLNRMKGSKKVRVCDDGVVISE